MNTGLDAYWLVAAVEPLPSAESAAHCVVRLSTSDILRDLSRGSGSLIRRHFGEITNLPGYIADNFESVRSVIASEVVARGFFAGGPLATSPLSASPLPPTRGPGDVAPAGCIGDFPVWHVGSMFDRLQGASWERR